MKKMPRPPRTDWNIDLSVRIEGIPLPFRLKAVTSDPDDLSSRLDDFMDLIRIRLLDEIDGSETSKENQTD